MLQDRPPKARWPRSQRFTLSEAGRAAEADYRGLIVASRAQEGRASFDAARTQWASTHRLEMSDGMYLSEVTGAPKTQEDFVRALDNCGTPKKDVLAALGRIFDAGLIVALPPTAG